MAKPSRPPAPRTTCPAFAHDREDLGEPARQQLEHALLRVRPYAVSSNGSDLAVLQGVWRQVAFEADGLGDARDLEGAADALTTFANNTFTVRTADGVLVLAGTFTSDETTTPRSVTWVDSIGADAGKPLRASYVLDSDRFIFIAANAGEPRPVVFRTGPGQTMRTFVRVR